MRSRPRRERVTRRMMIEAVEAMPLKEVLDRLDALKRQADNPAMWGLKLLLYERAVELLLQQNLFNVGEGNSRLIPAAAPMVADGLERLSAAHCRLH